MRVRAVAYISGAVLVVLSAIWLFVGAAAGRPVPVVALLFASSGAFVLGHRASGRVRPLVPAAVAASALVWMVLWPSETFSRAPLAGPFGYSNARGAFYASAAIAALMAGVSFRGWGVRILALAVAGGLASVPLATGSVAAAAVATLLPAFVLGTYALWSGRAAVGLAASVLVAALAGTTLAALSGPGDDVPGGRRVELWRETIEIISERPLGGVGLGRFAAESEIARADSDVRWAHQEFLQYAAEAGLPALVLLLLLVGSVFVALSQGPRPDAVTALGAAALAGLGAHACLDYVLHFPAIPLVVAALAGAGGAQAALHEG